MQCRREDETPALCNCIGASLRRLSRCFDAKRMPRGLVRSHKLLEQSACGAGADGRSIRVHHAQTEGATNVQPRRASAARAVVGAAVVNGVEGAHGVRSGVECRCEC